MKEPKTEKISEAIDVETTKSKQQSNNPYSELYIPIGVTRAVLMLLESTDIITKSMLLDIITHRYGICKQSIEYLTLCRPDPRYITDAQAGVEQYRVIYSKDSMEDFQGQLIINPSLFLLNSLYAQWLNDAKERFAAYHLSVVDGLKKQDAIQRHYDKIQEQDKLFLAEISRALGASK